MIIKPKKTMIKKKIIKIIIKTQKKTCYNYK